MIHEDDQFAHAGGHGDERFFSGGQQAGIKRFENAVMARGVERPCRGRSARPRARRRYAGCLSAPHCRGCRARRPPGRRPVCGLRVPNSGISASTVAATAGPTPGMVCSRLAFRASPASSAMSAADGRIALLDLLVEQLVELAVLAHAERIGVVLGAVVFGGEAEDELAAALGQIGQPLLLGRGPRGWPAV